ncbi:MAG: hypothetical protein IIB11_01450 [Chloroflexi bacterium]|nr:hypothetical protein [Chloroflexota bacterium]
MPSPHQVQVNVLDGVVVPHSQHGVERRPIVKTERLEYPDFPYGITDLSGLGTAHTAEA